MSMKILIVDDAMFMRLKLKKIIEENGCIALEATNGQEACDIYDQEHPDLTFMDITMPIMNGIDALVTILRKDPQANVVMCSAIGQDSMMVEALNKGAKDFIVKPFTPQSISQTIEKFQ